MIDGITIGESIAILEYLEETRKDKPLLPSDPFKKAKVRQLCQIINTGVQPYGSPGTMEHLPAEKRDEFGLFWITKGIKGKNFCLATTFMFLTEQSNSI